MTTQQQWMRHLAETLVVASIYVVFTRIGFALAFANSQVSPVWPPEGLALAALLLRGSRSFWGILLGAGIGNYINLPDLIVCTGIGLANSLGALLNVALVRRCIGGGEQLMNRVRNVVLFIVWCTPLGSALSATIGVGSLSLGGYVAPEAFAWTWVTWWFGEMQGYLIVGTALVVWFGGPRMRLSLRQGGELLALTLALAIVSMMVFVTAQPIIYAPIPFMIWAAFRFRQLGASIFIVVLSGVAIVATVTGNGPFAITSDGILQLNNSLLLLQAYLGFLSLTAFVLVATVRELEESESQKEKLEAELTIGREIQMSMVPPESLESSEFLIHATLRPARQVSGDFYDFFLIDHDHLCVIVGDVSGKGVPAALFMVKASTLLRSSAMTESSVGSALTKANRLLCAGNELSMFVTVFAAVVDLGTGALAYTNAGHNPSYIIKAQGSTKRLDQLHGPVVGVIEGVQYREDAMSLGPGDMLVAYTDGVTEAMDSKANLFSEDRFVALLTSLSARDPRQVVRATMAAVERFEDGAEPADDTTILALKYRGCV